MSILPFNSATLSGKSLFFYSKSDMFLIKGV
nr:MAG TPA: hypothetical protein [Caudoviricetes sp.]